MNVSRNLKSQWQTIHSEWQCGKWMNVDRNLVAPLPLRKRFTIECHLIHSTGTASDLI